MPLFSVKTDGAGRERYEAPGPTSPQGGPDGRTSPPGGACANVASPGPILPHYADPADRDRLAGQNARILALLESKIEVSNAELAGISLKYTSRLSEVRAWLERRGRTVRCRRADGGLTWYSIRLLPLPLEGQQ